uniref:27 kDa salivary protein SP20 n=1 Tax=Phlebotomus argentipes TaxID=94469 RepID=Q0ZST2_PHLAR|nr:27 kDa salivary protein SP20 [Phlebotomus argentipes]
MASAIGYCALLLICSHLVLGNIKITQDFGDFPKLIAFITNIIKNAKSLRGPAFGISTIRIKLDNLKIDLTSILKTNETRKDKILIRTGAFTVKNHDDSEAEAQRALKLPFIGSITPTLTFSNTKTTSTSDTTEEWVTVQPQKVKLKARSQKEVKFNLYREELEQIYNLEFTVDPNTIFTVTRIITYPSLGFSSTSRIYDKLNLRGFLTSAYKHKIEFKDSHFIKYDYKTNKLMIKNYTAVRNVFNDVVEVSLGKEEPLK